MKISIKNLTPDEKYVLLEKVSRGWSQRYLVEDILRYGITDELHSYMKSSNYYTQYIDSYMNVMDRLQEEIEETVVFISGPKGGRWGGYFKIKEEYNEK